MKAQILLIALLITGIFATALSFAKTELIGKIIEEKDAEKNVELKSSADVKTDIKLKLEDYVKAETKAEVMAQDINEIKGLEIEKSEKEDTIKMTENSEGNFRLGFLQLLGGTGYINNGDSGYLIAAFWSIQKFVKADPNGVIETNQDTKSFGKLRIARVGKYDLELLEKPTENDISFTVKQKGNRVGKLKLNKKASYKGLIIWTGALNMESSEFKGSWTVELATDTSIIKPESEKSDEADSDDFILEKADCKNALAGDANFDKKLDISDAVYISMYLRAEVDIKCKKASDVNGDGKISEEDRDYILNYLFKGGPAPVEAASEKKAKIETDSSIKLGNPKLGFWTKIKNFFFGK